MIRHHPVKTAVALSVSAAALLVAGCGGSSSSGNVARVRTVRAAYVSSSGLGYQVAMKVSGNAAGHAINVTGTGTFDQADHACWLTMNIRPSTAGGKNLRITAVSFGKDVYVKVPASLAPDGHWIAFSMVRSGFQDIYAMPAFGGRAHAITHGPTGGGNFEPAWQPDLGPSVTG